MELKKNLNFLENTNLFKDWKKEHQDAYLVHFLIIEKGAVSIGYYEPIGDNITTFQCGSEITMTVDTEIFKEQKIIPRLAEDKIKITLERAKEIAESRRRQDYPHDIPTKEIIVLQTLNSRPIYNMSFVTNTFKLLSVRINAETGDVEEEKMISLMDFVEAIENKKQVKPQ